MHGLIFETSVCYWQNQPGCYLFPTPLAQHRVRHVVSSGRRTRHGATFLHSQTHKCVHERGVSFQSQLRFSTSLLRRTFMNIFHSCYTIECAQSSLLPSFDFNSQVWRTRAPTNRTTSSSPLPKEGGETEAVARLLRRRLDIHGATRCTLRSGDAPRLLAVIGLVSAGALVTQTHSEQPSGAPPLLLK